MSLLHAIRKRYSVTADPLRTQRRIELAAVLLGCLLCLQVAYDGVRLLTLEMPEAVEPAADSMRVPGVRTSETVAASERRELVGRPLFWAGRRPVEVVDIPEDTPAEDATASELRDVKQVGVFGSGEEAGIIALVKGKKRRILLGETLDGWTLESIESTESEFVRGEERQVLSLRQGEITAPRVIVEAAAKAPQEDVPAAGVDGATQRANEPGPPGAAPGAQVKAGTEAEEGLGLGQRRRTLGGANE